jgi:alanine racemase
VTQHLREAVVDLDAVRHNTAVLKQHAGEAGVMAVVKADAYGHGLVECARAVLDGGATWLGVSLVQEALALRSSGITVPVLAWMTGAGEDLGPALQHDVDLSASSVRGLEAVCHAARTTGRRARVHLKIDTGMGRSGSTPADWADLVQRAARAEREGLVDAVAVWSHLASADLPGDPTTDRQLAVYHDALAVAERAGLRPHVRHLANSAALLTRPETCYDLVRPGLALYGLSPIPFERSARDLGLRPAMTLRAFLTLTKRVPAGHGVSYQHRYVTSRETTLGVVPLGYADGIPRAATNVGPVLAAGRRRTVAGVVCMDQVVVDLGDDPAEAGDAVVLFGPGGEGEPTAQDWADAIGTISYEIVSRIGARVVRRFVGEHAQAEAASSAPSSAIGVPHAAVRQ